jgi:hypothetical protein
MNGRMVRRIGFKGSIANGWRKHTRGVQNKVIIVAPLLTAGVPDKLVPTKVKVGSLATLGRGTLVQVVAQGRDTLASEGTHPCGLCSFHFFLDFSL